MTAIADSVTTLGDVRGKVLVAGSHGGIVAAYLGANAGAHALILNDAGIGERLLRASAPHSKPSPYCDAK